MSMTETVTAAFAAAVRRDPATPLLTYYDDASGERTELSGATLDNWASKTANLLVDGVGVGPGDTIAVLLPAHWQAAAVLLGAAAAGVAVDLGPDPQPVEALFTSPDRLDRARAWPAGDRYATGLLPFAMPLRELPPGFVDYPTEVRTFGDHFRAVQPVGPDDVAFAGPVELSHGEVMDAARRRAAELGVAAGDRVLIDALVHPDPVDWLVMPLAAGASVVLCANLDVSAVQKRVSAERITVTLA
jgi:uncharacterized protein (TIGR03089 family)